MTGSPAPHGRALLVALTPESRIALGAPEREITLPYRVGRESRGVQRTPQGVISERRNPGARPSNDLYLVEHEEALNVSREHFEIAREEGAGCILVDRASTCGTIVEGQTVGGDNRGGTLSLHDGDVIIVGTSRSPYVFKFRIG